MTRDRQPVCITCGQPVAVQGEVNRLPTGEPCHACRDRLLDALPTLLPRDATERSRPGRAPEDVEVVSEDPSPDDPIRA